MIVTQANNQLLLKEIKEINKKLIEVVVDVMAVEDVYREGTLVRCSYNPIGLSSNIKTSNTSKFMVSFLRISKFRTK